MMENARRDLLKKRNRVEYWRDRFRQLGFFPAESASEQAEKTNPCGRFFPGVQTQHG